MKKCIKFFFIFSEKNYLLSGCSTHDEFFNEIYTKILIVYKYINFVLYFYILIIKKYSFY